MRNKKNSELPILQQLAIKRGSESLHRAMEADRNGLPIPPVPLPGSPEYAAEELKDVMKLPAAESALFNFAHADILSEKIAEHLRSGDPDLEKHAMAISAKLISAVIKAQKNATAPITINQQINTGGVPIAGTRTSVKQDSHVSK